MDLTEKIKAVRLAKGIKQTTVARALGIDPPHYHRIENRGNKMSVEQLESISEALGVSLMDLLTYDGSVTYLASPLQIAALEKQVADLEVKTKNLKVLVSAYQDLKRIQRASAASGFSQINNQVAGFNLEGNPDLRVLYTFTLHVLDLLGIEKDGTIKAKQRRYEVV